MNLSYQTIERTDFPIGKRYEGKVRDVYDVGKGELVIVTTDRISAFDQVLGTIPYKGQILNELSAFWFEKTKQIVPNHFIKVIDPNISVVRKLERIPLEIIVRGHFRLGDVWQELDEPIVTPTTKEKIGHDLPIDRDEIIKRKILVEEEYDRISGYALELFIFGRNLSYRLDEGFTLFDAKYEFGKDSAGNIILMDEIHTPDCSRTQGQFDKEFLREWLKKNKCGNSFPKMTNHIKRKTSSRYIKFHEVFMDKKFIPAENPTERMTENLRKEGYLK